MALTLHLKYIENLRGKSERLVKVTFRGVAHYSKVIENVEDCCWFDETFTWPVARPVDGREMVEVQLFNYNKYLNNRQVGFFQMLLQELVETGHVKITDHLLNENNVMMKTKVTLELTYNAPDGSVGVWQREGMDLTNEAETLTEEDKNLLNVERNSESESLVSSPSKSRRGSKISISSKSSTGKGEKDGSKRMKIRSVARLMKLGKQRPPMDEEDGPPVIQIEDAKSVEGMTMEEHVDPDLALVQQMLNKQDEEMQENIVSEDHLISYGGAGTATNKKSIPQPSLEQSALKAQDFQVCVTIIEGRQLAGLNMDPVVCVQVGDQKKYTSVKESTNCPYYNEYFVFDFHMAPTMLFDKIITLTVLHSRNLIRKGSKVGSFKIDLYTIYSHADHQFYHKWAMLTDPDDINGGAKGFLKCDIAVVGKGDSVKVPPKSDADEDDIEANLLLPEGVSAERQKARYIVKVYKAEGLPKMNTGVMASVKKAFTGEAKDLVDPYVQVSFAGHKGKTSVQKGSYDPVWNEQVVFTEMFPPLCRRMQIQLRDNDSVQDDIIGTHFVDLSEISNEGQKGFLPTYGPSWINLYGSTRDFSLLDEHKILNLGLGEGVSYRARLLIAIKTEIIDMTDMGPTKVEVEQTAPVSVAGKLEDFLLYGVFMDATMIDKRFEDKPLHFELSIGNCGNGLDGQNVSAKSRRGDSSSEEESGDEGEGQSLLASVLSSTAQEEKPMWQSTTTPRIPQSRDRMYFHLPYYDSKPCTYVCAKFEDHRRRLYNTNMIRKIVEKLEDGLQEVNDMISKEIPFPERRLRGVFDEFANACSRYVSLCKGSSGSTAGRTKLDKERQRLCQREIDQIGTLARTLRATVTKNTMKDKLKAVAGCVTKLKHLANEPQDSLPDIFVWMLCGQKRIAYQRISSRDVIHSMVDEERGNLCGKVVTLYLKLPGKRATGASGWSIQCKLNVYLWLGMAKHRKELLMGLPQGYEESEEITQALKVSEEPPLSITYTVCQTFQLRAHMYQARSLIGSDASGLSDPFARVIFQEQSSSTQVINETLSPTWDEMLIFNEIVLHGTVDDIAENPPTVIIEIFDSDRVGKSEFIGRAVCKPIVKKVEEKYERPKFPPKLEWWDIYRGHTVAGELLAAFELLQFPFDEMEVKRALVTPPYQRKRGLSPLGEMSADELPAINLPDTCSDTRGPILPVPKGIRPFLSKYRVEVLFWGVRDLKRVQLTSVDRPRVDIECAGHVLQSTMITNMRKNPNFSTVVKHMDLELPDNHLYCPPITIRCVDCRNFGRFVLVGTHVINSLQKFMYTPTTKAAREAASKLLQLTDSSKPPPAPGTPQMPPLGTPQLGATPPGVTQAPPTRPSLVVSHVQPGVTSVRTTDVAVTIDENFPLIGSNKGETIISIEQGKADKTEENKKRKGSTADEDDLDTDTLDWWSKYFASVEMMIMGFGRQEDDQEMEMEIERNDDDSDAEVKEHEKQRKRGRFGLVGGVGAQQENVISDTNAGGYGAIPNGNAEDPGYNAKEAKKMEKELHKIEKEQAGSDKEKSKLTTFKGAVKAVTLTDKLSPKTQRKKSKYAPSTAQLKGFINKAFNRDSDSDLEGDDFESDRAKRLAKIQKIVIYPCELEAVPEFSGFTDWLHTFELYRGKKTGDDADDESRVVGTFKGSLKIYKIPLPPDIEDSTFNGGDPSLGLFQGVPSNDPIHVRIRVYVVKATDLHPMDINGKADPYLLIRCGKTVINDKEHYVSKQLNPVFGKGFDIEATFPMESILTVQVYDWDLVGADDLIGETKIDLENRYYSRHRATVGLHKTYEVEGYNAWRDSMKPTQILAKLCKDNKIDGPHYTYGKVKVANRVFSVPPDVDAGKKNKNVDEHLALAVLHHWEEIPSGCKLVPEHVETRALFNPEKPGIEQGKIELWVDLFPMDMPAPGPPVDVSPRKPKSYELRCIIWNTDEVVMEDDDFFTGEKMSDIYVKGWFKGPDDNQSTDIHYRSLTGEGNFNWRFIFPFDYLMAEEKIVISRKETMFSWDETETKIPARLELQVWDADHFSADDFLGSLTLDLNHFPRGAKSAKQCTLDMLKPDAPHMSIFKHKRVKGWWPFTAKSAENDDLEITGKVEAELHLITAEEAEKHPAGLGRSEPDPLEKPKRPDTSFIWFLNPLKSIRYILCNTYKWLIIKILVFTLLVALLVLFFYAMPGYTVKKMFGA
ncbi:otoferlin isoform X3 [Lingula anatina]|uniref:Otoferlin isoform X3 n=1 Tax=Lingula anatina TaxID=7574 RepID=A0A1S3H0M6_LINAN|nr:otoferlin isoform X3 [Lingula anatina]|eukprot:XP_013379026.1 otoferlin isoform X3 [Lingula anatina]